MLLFLHGFLGSPRDFDPLISHLPCEFVAPVLPGHGDLPMVEDLPLFIHNQVPKATAIIGYSAGGRCALQLKARFPERYGKVIAISAHPGIDSQKEREERFKQDQIWIEMLETKPLSEFLGAWYAQPLFATLKQSDAFEEMLKRRMENQPAHLAAFLRTFSSGLQAAPPISSNTVFVFGERDLKYEKLYRKLAAIHRRVSVKNAGHALHLENPKELANVIQGALDERI